MVARQCGWLLIIPGTPHLIISVSPVYLSTVRQVYHSGQTALRALPVNLFSVGNPEDLDGLSRVVNLVKYSVVSCSYPPPCSSAGKFLRVVGPWIFI